MTTALAVVQMVAIETILIVWLAMKDPRSIFIVINANMVFISMFAPALLDFGWGVASVGCIFYAAVACTQCIILETQGIEASRFSISRVNCWLTMVFLVSFSINNLPGAQSGGEHMEAIRLLTHQSSSIIVASFGAFYLSQTVLVRVWLRVRFHYGPIMSALIATWACQAVDTPIFFAVAFWDVIPAYRLLDMIAIGFVFKCGVSIMLIPAFYVAVHGARLLEANKGVGVVVGYLNAVSAMFGHVAHGKAGVLRAIHHGKLV